MIIRNHPSTRSSLVSKALLDNVNLAKDIGFDVRPVVCDRNTAYKEPVDALPTGVVLIYDYLHLLKRYKAIIEKTKKKYDLSTITKLYKQFELTIKFWPQRGPVLTVSAPRYSGEVVQFFNDATPAT
ncbi:hypothetical protein GQX74_009552 [Glossina fuscipes]|nr:hypothetical protein GQX74_009552 [Glossina fuscipes]